MKNKLFLVASLLAFSLLIGGAQAITTSGTLPNPYFWPAIVVFLLGLALAIFGFITRYPAFVLISGLVWIVLGVMVLSGQAIPNQSYAIDNYTYANASTLLIGNVNTTVAYSNLGNGNDFYQLGMIGVIGFALVGIGLYLSWLAIMAVLRDANNKEAETEEL